MHIVAPTLGIRYITTFTSTFNLSVPQSGRVLYFSLMTPILVGVLFAIVQFFEDYEGHLSRQYRKVVKTKETEEFIAIVQNTLWGTAIGFFTTMVLFIYLMGKQGTYTIPYIITVTSSEGLVSGSTTIISICTILGLLYGLWQAVRISKHKGKGRHVRKTRVTKKT